MRNGPAHKTAYLWRTLALSLLLAAGIASQPPPGRAQISGPEGRVTVKVALVGDDLSVRPVPKKAFTLCRPPTCSDSTTFTTSFQGEITLEVGPGSYLVKSTDPVEFEGKLYAWEVAFEVPLSATTTLELSYDNATVTPKRDAVAGAEITDEGRLYQRVTHKPTPVKWARLCPAALAPPRGLSAPEGFECRALRAVVVVLGVASAGADAHQPPIRF